MFEKFRKKVGENSITKFTLLALSLFAAAVLTIAFYYLIDKPDKYLGFISKIINALSPIITGMVIAFVLNPLMKFYKRHLDNLIEKIKIKKDANKKTKIKKEKSKPKIISKLIKKEKKPKKESSLSKYLSIVCAMLTLIIAIVIIISIIVPNLINNVVQLSNDLPKYAKSIIKYAQDKLPESAMVSLKKDALPNISKWINNNLLSSVSNITSIFTKSIKTIYSATINLIVGIIVSFYVLASKDYFKKISLKILNALFRNNVVTEITNIGKEFNRVFSNYIVGQLVDSVIVGILCFIILMIFQIPYALLVSFIICVTNLIPFFGPIIGSVPSAFLILLNDPIKAIYFLVIILILQQIDGNIIAPRILKDSLGISPFWIVFSIMLFSDLFGIIGMIIAAPLFSIIYSTASRIINNKLKKKEIEKKEIKNEN